jgi:hypothetical protein
LTVWILPNVEMRENIAYDEVRDEMTSSVR